MRGTGETAHGIFSPAHSDNYSSDWQLHWPLLALSPFVIFSDVDKWLFHLLLPRDSCQQPHVGFYLICSALSLHVHLFTWVSQQSDGLIYWDAPVWLEKCRFSTTISSPPGFKFEYMKVMSITNNINVNLNRIIYYIYNEYLKPYLNYGKIYILKCVKLTIL